jgi:DTW domain-containing protein YfiP
MPDTLPAKRAHCATCLRAQSACICRWIAPVVSGIELLVLQHPLEVANAKNSARLLHLSVAGSVLVAGETFEPDRLQRLLHGGGRVPLLLYPHMPGDTAPAAPSLPDPARLRLVVVDATWRKSRKMLYLNPMLQQLPRLTLRDMPPSSYRIRKAHAADQMSTLEAAAYALMQLNNDAQRFQSLLTAFDGFVTQQAAFAPP